MSSRLPVTPPPQKTVVEFSVGVGCPHRCLFCSDHENRLNAAQIAIRRPDELEARLATVEPGSLIRFGGFEPTTNPRLAEFIALAKTVHPRSISVGTNGRALSDRAYLDRLIDAGMTTVELSIHGHTDALHDRLCGKTGGFQRVRQGLANLQSAKQAGEQIDYFTQTVVNHYNAPQLESIARFLGGFSPHTVVMLGLKYIGAAKPRFQELVERYDKLVENVNRWDLAQLPARTAFQLFPHCILVQLPRALFGYTELLDLRQSEKGSSTWISMHDYAKQPACQTCACQAFCFGVPSLYAEHFGWSEFKPVTAKRWDTFFRTEALFLSRHELERLVAPFSTQTPRAGWWLGEIEQSSDQVRLTFHNERGQTVGLKLRHRNASAEGVFSSRFAICFDGTELPSGTAAFWETLVKVIQTNDRHLTK